MSVTPPTDPSPPPPVTMPESTPPRQPQAPTQAATTSPDDGKAVGCLVLDTGALIKNEPTVSTLLAQANELYTIPAVLAEIRDAETRRRVDTTLRPFLKIRSPKSESIKFITSFARKTGDLEVMSAPDIHLLALTYELECEKNGGDWRLRNTPLQKHLNGQDSSVSENRASTSEGTDLDPANPPAQSGADPVSAEDKVDVAPANGLESESTAEQEQLTANTSVEENLAKITLEESGGDAPSPIAQQESSHVVGVSQVQPSTQTPIEGGPEIEADGDEDGDSDDSDGWITPSNLKKHLTKDQGTSLSANPTPQFLQAALLTTDYAMQNVALRINLNLLSPSMFRITRLRTYVLRCHGCFSITKDMTKQFCPRCGQPNLIRTSCSTDANGVFQVHLRKNFEYNKRGNVYSIPKPVHGTSSGKTSKVRGGGRNGWGQSLILAEDQKEYVRAKDNMKRTRQRDLMDQDYLPGILTGERTNSNDKVRVGAGRSVNSRKKW
ncbi:hypothetical protein jhhlp_005848 [Lomentospora prolificans]|uniref:20S-pre-rRNA D-site endonuclease NOB1 n=1 Tax=Lomentospora prolificans TaxID=41688 RepID=A0A2N3N492_9PEZI|nr:hypothetical protein jhhlp_005848 [Lomentospora prolificans]